MTRRTWTLVAVVLASGTVFLDSTVVNVALNAIGQELPGTFVATLEGQSYVVYGYLLTLSALLILAGALADTYGRRRMFLIGLAGFGVASVLCGVAPTLELLIAFRLLQGVFGALLVPTSLAIITATFQGAERGRAFGVWAAASGATTLFGPLLGGFLVDTISWRVVFLINVPLIAVALYAGAAHVAESTIARPTAGSTGSAPSWWRSRSAAFRSVPSAARSSSGAIRWPGSSWPSAPSPWSPFRR